MQNTKKQAAALRQRVLRERSSSGLRVRFSKALRGDVVEFVGSSGLSRAESGRLVGLSDNVVGRWLRGAKGNGSVSNVARLQRVKVVEQIPRATTSGFTLTFPSGARVDGIEFEQLRALLGGAT